MDAYRSRFRELGSLASVAGPGRGEATIDAPFTGETLGVLPLAGPTDLDLCVGEARTAQEAWARTPVSHRVRIVNRFRRLLLDRCEPLLDVLQLETGKARRQAFEEVADVAAVAGYYARSASDLLRVRRRRGAVPGLTRTTQHQRPIGVAGVIAPWNYPLVLAVSDSLPAVLAGNAVIVKPDIQTTHTALAALELLLEAGMPPGVLQVVPGDGPGTGAALVERADCVSFTGSTATGRVVATRAGERLVACSLELGGKNPMIVREDADLERAVSGAVRGCFASAGQLCIATERLLVHRSIFDDFATAFVERTRSLRLGAGLDYEADMGSLTHQRQLQKIEEHVGDAVERGAEIRTGGMRREDLGPLFYEPTVLTGVTPDMRMYGEETFGPVVSLHPFGTDADAVRLANDTRYGLSASIYSGDTDAALLMARRVRTGMVNINEAYSAAWGSVDAPVGGRGDSGTGRRHGAEGLLKFTESQIVAVQRVGPLDLSASWLRRPRVRRAALGLLKRYRPGASRH